MRFGFTGASYTPYATSQDTQRTVNLYPEKDESGAGKNAMVLIGTPGLSLLLRLLNITITAGGAGYTANDILTVVGGVLGAGTAARIKVLTVAAGVVATVSVDYSGVYASDPTDPVSVTGGTGTGATFTLNWGTAVQKIFYETKTKRTFVVSRLENSTIRIFEITLAGVQTDRGQLAATVGTLQPVSISTNGLQMFIVVPEMNTAFIYTLATNVVTNVTASVGNTFPVWGVFLDEYFIALCTDGKVYLSALLDGTTWDALDTAKAESSPDLTIMIRADHGELWQWGTESTEVWYDSGAADFPFEPIRSATVPRGIMFRYSNVSLDNKLYWVGRGQDGKAMVWEADGYRPNRISNHAVENSIQSLTLTGSMPVAFGYQSLGHSFYVLTFPEDSLTWVYDAATKMWHERMFLSGSTEQSIRPRCHCFAGGEDGSVGMQLVGDRQFGYIFDMSTSYFDDASFPIRRERRTQHLSNELKRGFYSRFQLEIQPGAGTFTLEYSNDGGATFSAALTGTSRIGGAARDWNRIGSGRDRVFRVRSTAAIKMAWIDAYLGADAGAS